MNLRTLFLGVHTCGAIRATADINKACKARNIGSVLFNVAMLGMCSIFPSFFTMECWGAYRCWQLKQKREETSKDKKVALMLETREVFPLLFFRAKSLEKLSQAGYDPVYHSIISTKDAVLRVESLKAEERNIALIWLQAHGNSRVVSINGDDRIGMDLTQEWHRVFKALDPKSTVIIEACQTARKSSCIAREIASALPPGGRVIASKEDINPFHVSIVSTQPFAVEFHRLFYEKKFWTEKDTNVTAVFHAKARAKSAK